MSPSRGLFRAFAAGEFKIVLQATFVQQTSLKFEILMKPSIDGLGGPMDSSIGVAFEAWNDKADELDNASNKIR